MTCSKASFIITTMIHPLKLWKSEEVKNLLQDFFKANFEASGIDMKLAEKILDMSWNAKGSKDLEVDMKEISLVFDEVKSKMRIASHEINPIELVDLSSVNTFLDVGANKFALINYIIKNHPNVRELLAIDVVPMQGTFLNPEICKYYQTDSEATQFPIPDQSVDLIDIQFVLHHFPDQESIERMIENCRKSLKKGGKLVLWEESFEENVNTRELAASNHKLKILTDQTLTERFYRLSEEQRWQFIIANDWIINVGNAHMQWSGMYKKWSEWIVLFEKHGFKLTNQYNLGIRINGKAKQGVHIVGVFEYS
jgi:SAM-dependent methyltransferase